MGDSTFRFKRFEVRNEKSAMKVNTDGTILGALAGILREPSEGCFRVLDAGTGTGAVALMCAQRLSASGSDFHVLGIDIDGDSAAEAGENFRLSPWSEHMEARHIPLEECDGLFGLIISNPPYFDASLENPDRRKNTARHTHDERSLSFRTLLDYAAEHLTPDGLLAMILPSDREKDLLACAERTGFRPVRIVRIKTVERKPPMRMVAEFKRKDSMSEDTLSFVSETLVMRNGSGYTAQYTALMKDFYLWA